MFGVKTSRLTLSANQLITQLTLVIALALRLHIVTHTCTMCISSASHATAMGGTICWLHVMAIVCCTLVLLNP